MQTHTQRNAIPYAPRDTISYPDTDGKPMAASDLHREILIWTLEALAHHFKNDVYVSGDIMMYDKQGNPRSSISPDVLVSFGIGQKQRLTYKVWEEGKFPEFVMEFSSKNTYRNDLAAKMERYAEMGIQDYFLYDAEGLYLPEQLMGFTLVAGRYAAIAADADGKIYSDALGLGFELRAAHFGIYDPETGQWLQTAREAAEARAQQEADARRQEVDARRNAEARAQQEVDARRNAEARTQQEVNARRNAETRAQQEANARRNAEAEITRLQEELARLGGKTK